MKQIFGYTEPTAPSPLTTQFAQAFESDDGGVKIVLRNFNNVQTLVHLPPEARAELAKALATEPS